MSRVVFIVLLHHLPHSCPHMISCILLSDIPYVWWFLAHWTWRHCFSWHVSLFIRIWWFDCACFSLYISLSLFITHSIICAHTLGRHIIVMLTTYVGGLGYPSRVYSMTLGVYIVPYIYIHIYMVHASGTSPTHVVDSSTLDIRHDSLATICHYNSSMCVAHLFFMCSLC